ncbi:MAG: aminodeoxychorismate synthase component I [Firmicutes bacterium]|nr:aminodeoxychorismate synthase component I [Bacillota bacterium]
MIRIDFLEDWGTLVFGEPEAVFRAQSPRDVLPALDAAEALRCQGYWLAGFLAYEAGAGLDPALLTHALDRFPLVWLAAFRAPEGLWRPEGERPRVGPWRCRTDEAAYRAAIGAIKEYIREGLTYQVNYTVRMDAPFTGDPRQWYDLLRPRQNAPFAAYVEAGDFAVLSLSPELFFRKRGSRIETRPMKGTAPRGYYDRDDRAQAEALRRSAKDRAENLMIVDLMRNDLGRLARWGSVRADPLCAVERYPTVWQMTSTVTADLLPCCTWVDAFRALFPSGSVTGAPKIRTMAIIRDLEPDPRGIYCGSVGVVRPDGDAVFNVAIRTVSVDRRRGRALYGSGGGITWDSEAGGEYREMQAKRAFLTSVVGDFAALETMAWVGGQWVLLAYHLERLQHAVEYFGWPWRSERVETALAEAVRGLDGAWRVRLLYQPDGSVAWERYRLEPRSPGVKRVRWAARPLADADAWIFHKTTWRQPYETCVPDDKAPDVFDYLLFNARGEITEFTRGNVVLRLHGRLVTPPLAAGLLPGTFRQHLLDAGAVEEQPITMQEAASATEMWFVNSVRGWVPVRLEGPLPEALGSERRGPRC